MAHYWTRGHGCGYASPTALLLFPAHAVFPDALAAVSHNADALYNL